MAGGIIEADVQNVSLQSLAYWLIRQGLTTVALERAEELIARELPSISGLVADGPLVMRYLLDAVVCCESQFWDRSTSFIGRSKIILPVEPLWNATKLSR